MSKQHVKSTISVANLQALTCISAVSHYASQITAWKMVALHKVAFSSEVLYLAATHMSAARV